MARGYVTPFRMLCCLFWGNEYLDIVICKTKRSSIMSPLAKEVFHAMTVINHHISRIVPSSAVRERTCYAKHSQVGMSVSN